MTQLVNRVLNRKSETKYASSRAGESVPHTYTVVNSVISGSGQWAAALPRIIQGTDDYSRIGDTIMPSKARVDLELALVDPAGTPTGTYSNPNPVDITAYIVYGYCKKYRAYNDVQANSAALSDQLLKLGGVDASGNEYTSFSGYREDADLIINDAIWHLKVKKVRLFKSPGQLNGPVSPGVISTPNKTTHKVRLDFSKMLPTKLKYPDVGDLLPINFSPVFSIGYYYNDGSPPDTTSGVGLLKYHATSHMFWKDF